MTIAVDVASHIDLIRRRMAPCRQGTTVVDTSGGWITVQASDTTEYASTSGNRVFWLTAASIGGAEINAAHAAAAGLGAEHMFVWLAPWARDSGTEAALQGAGMTKVPYVDYIALARPAASVSPARPTLLVARHLAPAELDGVLRYVVPWYGEAGAATARRMVDREIGEFHAVFDGDEPIALGMLVMGGEWAYVGAAGTDPKHRGRGAQTALICSRVTRAAALGARWCAAETNTVVTTSLNNLRRCGFDPALSWRVFKWALEPASG